MRYLVGILFCLSIIILSPACVTSTPRFDAYAYRNSVSLKVDSLQLMAKAGDPYAKHAEAAEQLLLALDKAYEYAHGRNGNEACARQWKILKAEERSLLANYLRRWQNRGTLPVAVIKEARKNVALAYDQIIGLESGRLPKNP